MSTFNTKLSPVKQELQKRFSLHELSVAYEFYSSYSQTDKKSSRIKEFLKFLDYCIPKYGKVTVLNAIYVLVERSKSGSATKSQLNLRYLEGIIKNSNANTPLAKELQAPTCPVCGTLLVNKKCSVCGT